MLSEINRASEHVYHLTNYAALCPNRQDSFVILGKPLNLEPFALDTEPFLLLASYYPELSR